MRRVRGLDGLRAVAVLGVLGYHGDLSWLPGGFLGVDVFFVLSGYLITGLLLEEVHARSRVDFGRFYRHRARRLLPALLLVLLATSAAAMQLAPDSVAQLRRDMLAAAGYYSNWHAIFAHQSYFERIGRPPLLLHLWSLAVEEQFYLCWPPLAVLVLLATRRRSGPARRTAVAAVAVAGAGASTAVMALLSVRSGYPVPNDPSRVYYGTDTHAAGLLLGAALAAAWPMGRLPRLGRQVRWLLDGAGVLALAGLVWAYSSVSEFTPGLYRGGFLVFSSVTALVVAVVVHPQCHIGRLLAGQPLRWVGERSYGLYLWHWPVFELTRPGLDLPLRGAPDLMLRLALTAALSELSWRLVETPIRGGALQRLRPALVAGVRRTGSVEQRQTTQVALAAGTGLVLVMTGLALDRPPAGAAAQVLDQPYPARPAGTAHPRAADALTAAPPTPTPPVSAPPVPAPPAGVRRQPVTVPQHPAAVAAGRPRPRGPVLAYGDSVMLGASAALNQALPGIRVNAVVGRQPTALIGDLQQLRASGGLAPVVVVHSGDNGVFAPQTFDVARDALSDRTRVVVVNVRVPRRWQDPVNSLLAQTVRGHPNAVLADWHKSSDGHPEYFVGDGVHLTVAGEDAFARLIAHAVNPG